MCRLAAFPPNFPRKKALDILMEFESYNEDGTGYAYVQNGKFKVKKWPKAVSKLVKHEHLLEHMPYPGWTLAHLRAKSHGEVSIKNTHPFVIGKWCICHNGIWSDHEVAKLALSSYVKFEGETDSEVAAHLINNIGPKKFATSLDGAGVFLALNLDGSLWIMKTSGDLVMQNLPTEQTLIASELDDEKYERQGEAFEGWYHFNDQGIYVAHKRVLPKWQTGTTYYGNHYGSHVPTSHLSFNDPTKDEDEDESRGIYIERSGRMPTTLKDWRSFD